MNEGQAKAWLVDRFNVSRETIHQLEDYAACVNEEQANQNLVSATTLSTFWSRHIVDSAQLLLFATRGNWLDIGSGAGVPGIITAIITGADTVLVEPRTRRSDFLRKTTEKLGLKGVVVVALPVQQMQVQRFDNITARAVTALPALIDMAMPFAYADTTWILPKGKSAKSELASLPRACQGAWTMHPSVTDPDSLILVGRHVKVVGKR